MPDKNLFVEHTVSLTGLGTTETREIGGACTVKCQHTPQGT